MMWPSPRPERKRFAGQRLRSPSSEAFCSVCGQSVYDGGWFARMRIPGRTLSLCSALHALMFFEAEDCRLLPGARGVWRAEERWRKRKPSRNWIYRSCDFNSAAQAGRLPAWSIVTRELVEPHKRKSK